MRLHAPFDPLDVAVVGGDGGDRHPGPVVKTAKRRHIEACEDACARRAGQVALRSGPHRAALRRSDAEHQRLMTAILHRGAEAIERGVLDAPGQQ